MTTCHVLNYFDSGVAIYDGYPAGVTTRATDEKLTCSVSHNLLRNARVAQHIYIYPAIYHRVAHKSTTEKSAKFWSGGCHHGEEI